MLLHIIEGETGCRYAADHKAAAVVVDALRASATAAALFFFGAREMLVTSTVDEALMLKEKHPEALLYGERGGVPPAGFDYGNSPMEAVHGRDKQIIFTTTTGAGRLVQAWGATPLLMGSTINCKSVVQYLLGRNVQEVVLVPAGLMNDPDFNAQEDWAAASYIAMNLCDSLSDCDALAWGNGYDLFLEYRNRIKKDGLDFLFSTAPHADKLRAIDKEEDILFCAQASIYDTLPLAIKRDALCITAQDACNPL